MATPLFELLQPTPSKWTHDEARAERLPLYVEDPRTDFQRLTAESAWFDFSFHGRIKMSGRDALDFLHRLSTNDIRRLEIGGQSVTVLTNEKGRLIDVITVIRNEDHLLLLTSANNQETVIKWLDHYVIMENIRFEDVTESTVELRFFGSESDLLAQRLVGTLQQQEPMPVSKPVVFGSGKWLVIANRSSTRAILDHLQRNNLQPVGQQSVECQRIESGQPLFRCELTEKYNPIEAGLLEFISFTKGCYVGQEVIARLDSYDKVTRALKLINLESKPTEPYRLTFENPRHGEVTSCSFSFTNDCWIALAIVKKEVTSSSRITLVDSAGAKIEASFR